jgi:hypothetical protein
MAYGRTYNKRTAFGTSRVSNYVARGPLLGKTQLTKLVELSRGYSGRLRESLRSVKTNSPS